MMLKKYWLVLTMLLVGQITLYSQTVSPQVTPIITGSGVPDDFWQRKHTLYHNGKTTETDLSAYKGKFLVLDFWNVNCGACIHYFPDLKKLQAKYGDKLNIVAVNDKDSYDKIHALYQGRMKERGIDDVSSIINDKYLSGLFQKNGYPHYIWITPGGNVIMQTFSIHFLSDEAVKHIVGVEGFFPKAKK